MKAEQRTDSDRPDGKATFGRSAYYGNFQDPFGLIYRMVRSGDRAAMFALCQAGFKVPLGVLDRLLEPLETQRLQDSGDKTLPIVLIVGPPRSGTMLTYQLLSQHLPLSYLNNWGAMFPRSTITASRILNRYGYTTAAALHSYYGNTAGFHGVNDGFHVWNRWLGNDRYSVPRDITAESRRDMRRFFAAWSETFNRPFLNKNNRNSFCMSLLSSILETAVFVVSTRKPVFVAQSLLLAREHIQGDASRGWGLGTHRPHRRPRPSPLEDVADQVRYVYERIEEQLAHVPPERVVHTCYEDICRDPGQLLSDVDELLRKRSPEACGSENPASRLLPPLPNTDRIKLPPSRFDELSALLHGVPYRAPA